MSLLERFRSSSRVMLPQGSVVGLQWGVLSRQRRTAVGIDIGAGALKVAQIRWTREGPRLENYAIAPLSSGMLDDGAIRNPGEMGEILQGLVTEMGMAQPFVGACVGGPNIIVRYINLPKVSVEEMRSAMKFEAPQHLPIPEDQLVYDFTLVPEATGVPEHQTAVFLSGTHKKLVDTYIATLGRAGLRPTALELDCMTALRTLEWLGLIPNGTQTPLVLLDIGEMDTRMSVMRYGVPMLSRTIPMGLYHLRTAVADAMNITASEAEASLRLKGLKSDSEVAAAVEPTLASLLESVSRSIEFFLIQNRGATLDRVFLIGGGAVLPHMAETLNNHMQLALGGRPEAEQVRVQATGLAGMDINPELLPDVNNYGPLLIGAIGSALREGSPE